MFLVTYLFRTTGQVLGVSLSGAVLQAVLLQKLRERIHGPDAVEVSDHFLSIIYNNLTIFIFIFRLFILFGIFKNISNSRLEFNCYPNSHTAQIIPTLEPHLRKAAVDAYADALRVVFICQAAISVLGFLACLPIQESPLS